MIFGTLLIDLWYSASEFLTINCLIPIVLYGGIFVFINIKQEKLHFICISNVKNENNTAAFLIIYLQVTVKFCRGSKILQLKVESFYTHHKPPVAMALYRKVLTAFQMRKFCCKPRIAKRSPLLFA